MYDENNKNDIVDTSYTVDNGANLNQVIFGAFDSWVNEQLKSDDVRELYIKIEADLYTDRNDTYRHSITIPAGKSLHLQLSSCKVGNDHGVTCVYEPYFLVEPGGKLEITGNGWIINTEETKDDASIQSNALILNYGTMKISGTIYLEREYKHTGYPHTDEFSRQHTIINYGTLEITGPESGVGASIDVLSTAAGKYKNQVCVGKTIVKNADVEMATVFAAQFTKRRGSVEGGADESEAGDCGQTDGSDGCDPAKQNLPHAHAGGCGGLYHHLRRRCGIDRQKRRLHQAKQQ